MVAKHDRQKVHKGRRKVGSRIRKRRWALRNRRKVRKVRHTRRRKSRS